MARTRWGAHRPQHTRWTRTGNGAQDMETKERTGTRIRTGQKYTDGNWTRKRERDKGGGEKGTWTGKTARTGKWGWEWGWGWDRE
eukprot:4149798-Lingulodinium_polyedra.AAC.1